MLSEEYNIKLNEFEVRLLIDVLYPYVRWGEGRKPLYDKLIKSLGYEESHFETKETLRIKHESDYIIKKYESMPDLAVKDKSES